MATKLTCLTIFSWTSSVGQAAVIAVAVWGRVAVGQDLPLFHLLDGVDGVVADLDD